MVKDEPMVGGAPFNTNAIDRLSSAVDSKRLIDSYSWNDTSKMSGNCNDFVEVRGD